MNEISRARAEDGQGGEVPWHGITIMTFLRAGPGVTQMEAEW